MAASKAQGSYLAVFWTAITVLCAGIAYFAEGFGKLVFLLGLAFFLGAHLPRHIHLGAGDMAVHVDSAGHDHESGRVEHTDGLHGWIGRGSDDFIVADPKVADQPIDAVGRIVDGPAGYF